MLNYNTQCHSGLEVGTWGSDSVMRVAQESSLAPSAM